MAARTLVWVIDTSSICEIRRGTPRDGRKRLFGGLTTLVTAGRLTYPKLVVEELKRNVDPANPDPQYEWANRYSAAVEESGQCTLDEVKLILAEVPSVLDPEKDSGVDEADPYVLAVAQRLRLAGTDARIVTEETKDTPKKMSMSTAAGILGIPCVPLMAFLRVEKLLE